MDERCESPEAGWTEKRLVHAKRSDRRRLKEPKKPKLRGFLYCSADGAVPPVFKKWTGLVFSTTPIQTGVSVEQDLLRQAIRGIMSGSESCPCPDLDLQSLPTLLLQGPGHSSDSVLPLSLHNMDHQTVAVSEPKLTPTDASYDNSVSVKYNIKYEFSSFSTKDLRLGCLLPLRPREP